MENISVPNRNDSGVISLHFPPVCGTVPLAAAPARGAARGNTIDPEHYQFICRDRYGVRFFLNERVHRGQGCFLTGSWVDRKGVHAVCGIYHEKTRTVSLFLSGKNSGTVMSHYTYLGDNRFAGVECSERRDSMYEMDLYMEKGIFPGLQAVTSAVPEISEPEPDLDCAVAADAD
jgi:hypothetical protein